MDIVYLFLSIVIIVLLVIKITCQRTFLCAARGLLIVYFARQISAIVNILNTCLWS